MQMIKRARSILFAAMLSVLVTGPLHAQNWPTKPIRIVVGFPPGVPPELAARALAENMSGTLGQPIVVETRPGAAATIAASSVAQAAPDGYTLLMGSIANTLNPHFMKGLGFTLDELAPVSSVAAAPDILAVHPSVPANNLKELLELLKAKPGTSAAIPGFGSTPHLSTVLLQSTGGVQLTIVPYQGGGPVLQGLIGNQVPVAFSTSVSIIPRLRAGQLRGIGVTSAKRITSMPELPTLAEQGLAGFDVSAWFGVFAPAKTPKAIIDRLSEETRKATGSADLKKRLVDLGAEPLGSTPEEFSAFVKAEYAKWGRVVKEAGIKAE